MLFIYESFNYRRMLNIYNPIIFIISKKLSQLDLKSHVKKLHYSTEKNREKKNSVFINVSIKFGKKKTKFRYRCKKYVSLFISFCYGRQNQASCFVDG